MDAPPSPLGLDQILATAIAVTESRSGRPDPHSGNHHRRDCYRHAAIVRGRGINTRHREAFFELRMYSTQQISAALSTRGTAGMFWYNGAFRLQQTHSLVKSSTSISLRLCNWLSANISSYNPAKAKRSSANRANVQPLCPAFAFILIRLRLCFLRIAVS